MFFSGKSLLFGGPFRLYEVPCMSKTFMSETKGRRVIRFFPRFTVAIITKKPVLFLFFLPTLGEKLRCFVCTPHLIFLIQAMSLPTSTTTTTTTTSSFYNYFLSPPTSIRTSGDHQKATKQNKTKQSTVSNLTAPCPPTRPSGSKMMLTIHSSVQV